MRGQGEPGQAHPVPGPNRRCKAALCRILACLKKADVGAVNYPDGDYILDHDPARRRLITLVLPKPALTPPEARAGGSPFR